jgi:hypothetical protein
MALWSVEGALDVKTSPFFESSGGRDHHLFFMFMLSFLIIA